MKKVKLKNGQEAIIRKAHPKDAARLLEVSLSVAEEERYVVTEPDEFQFTEDEEKQWIKDHIEQPGKALFVAEIDGKAVGFINFENGRRRRLAHAGTFGVSIEKNWRAFGLGKALVETLLEWAENNPLIEKVGLAVFSNNERAIRLYKKLGFVEEGRSRRAVKLSENEYVDDILMCEFV